MSKQIKGKRVFTKRKGGKRLPNLVRRTFPSDDPVFGLQFIADRLNNLAYLNGDSLRAWQDAETIVLCSVTKPDRGTIITGINRFPSLAVRRFNRFAEQATVRLYVRQEMTKRRRLLTTAHINSSDAISSATWYLWRFFFQKSGWERLKHCPQCRKWFVDETRNKKKERCSDRCTARWWNRDRRKTARHRTVVKKRSKKGSDRVAAPPCPERR